MTDEIQISRRCAGADDPKGGFGEASATRPDGTRVVIPICTCGDVTDALLLQVVADILARE